MNFSYHSDLYNFNWFFCQLPKQFSLSRELGRKLEGTSLPILGALQEELAVILVTFVISFQI